MSVDVEPGFLLPFKSKSQYPQSAIVLLPLSSSLLNFGLFLYPLSKPPHVCFQITPVIYSVRWDRQTRWPLDYHVLHIQIHCLKFPMAKTSSSTSLSFSQPTHPQQQEKFSHTIKLYFFQTFWRHCLVHTQMTTYFCGLDSQAFVWAAETIYVLQALPICSPTSLWAAPIMVPVCDRDGWEPRGAHKTCSGEGGMKEGGMEQGREGKEWTAGASSSLSGLERTLEDSVRRSNCCPLHH